MISKTLQSLSSPVKYLLTVIFTTVVVSSVLYAADITSTSQTANTGDRITAQWVNAVNTKANAIPAAAAGGSVSCSANQVKIVCVWSDGTCRSFDYLGDGSWHPCSNALN